jgi:hypothetical protein
LRTTNNQYKYSDEFGSYTVCFGDRTIEVKLIGLLSEQLLNKFCDDLGLMLSVIEWQFWGYYGDLSECDDKSVINGDFLVNLRQRFLNQGCIVESYTISAPESIESIVKLRVASGLENVFSENNIFSDRAQATEYIHNILSKVQNQSESAVDTR